MTGLQMSCEIHPKFKLTDLSLQADFRDFFKLVDLMLKKCRRFVRQHFSSRNIHRNRPEAVQSSKLIF